MAVAAIVAIAGLIAACAAAASGDLGVRTTALSVKPGAAITGTVANPSGKVAVALQDYATHELLTCTYRSGKKSFSCPTPVNQQGLYVIGVTDTGHTGQGTVKIPVAVTTISGYAPEVSVQNRAKPGQDVVVSLLMWGAKRGVTVKVLDEGGTMVLSRRAVTDTEGKVSTTLSDLKAGSYRIVASDNLWTVGGAFGKKVTLTVAD